MAGLESGQPRTIHDDEQVNARGEQTCMLRGCPNLSQRPPAKSLDEVACLFRLIPLVSGIVALTGIELEHCRSLPDLSILQLHRDLGR